jgi:hypothetical protein
VNDNGTLAIMREVGYGNRDLGRPCLWFSTYIDESSAALQVLQGDEAEEVIRESGVYDVRDLEGKPCWVDTSEHGRIRFMRVWKK